MQVKELVKIYNRFQKSVNLQLDIGDMLLLSQKLNGQIQNREFVVKVEGKEKIGKGGRYCKGRTGTKYSGTETLCR